jgi:hypothetical protein
MSGREDRRAPTFPTWTNWPDELNPDSTSWHVVEARGWPLLALRSEYTNKVWVSGFALPRKPGPSHHLELIRSLPLRSLWPGFAINTIFYAAIVWMLFAVPGMVRRRVRRKRGKCAARGYSLRENVSAKCPECGRSCD